MTAPVYFTPAEVRDRLRLGASTLANWRDRRKGPPYVKFGARVLYPIEALLDWERKNTVETHA